jgi:ATP-dependent DNA ligase
MGFALSPLIGRKHRLKRIMPKVETGPLRSSRRDPSTPVNHDLEGILGKWKFGTYRAEGAQTSWLKIKNPSYSQAEGSCSRNGTAESGGM